VRKDKQENGDKEREDTITLGNEDIQNDNPSSSNVSEETQPTNLTIGNREKEKSIITNTVKKISVQVMLKNIWYYSRFP
jgi:hypothetical protein